MKRTERSSWMGFRARLVEVTFWVAIVAVVVISAMTVLRHSTLI
jgi:hypothetical protein